MVPGAGLVFVRVNRTSSLIALIFSQTRAAAVYNASSKTLRNYATEAKAAPTEVSSILEQRIRGVQEEAGLAETGRVLSVG
jgi:F-type H+-transporting ATPase subunit alpha